MNHDLMNQNSNNNIYTLKLIIGKNKKMNFCCYKIHTCNMVDQILEVADDN